MKSDCVIVRANNQKIIYPGLEEKGFTGIEPPLWGGILAGFLRDKGYRVALLDAQVEQWNYTETAENINSLRPLLTIIVVSGTNPSASTMNMVGVENLSPLLKSKVMLHGLHPSALPKESLNIEGVDYVCEGEGFYTIPPVLETLRNGPALEQGIRIPGLWTQNKIEPLKPRLYNLSELGRPAWDLLPIEEYRAHFELCFGNIPRSPYALIYTSLGCSYNCSFCAINALFSEKKMRFRTIKSIVDEIAWLNETYGVTNIKIIDELFGLCKPSSRKQRLLTLCKRIENLKLNLNMRVYARVDTVDDETLEAMKRAGINWIGYGFEAGSPKVLKNVKKGTTLERTYETVRLTYKHGLHIGANYLFGLPKDTDETHTETFKLMLDLNCEWANVYTIMPFPGSALYQEALKSGWIPPEKYSGWSQYTPDSHPLRGEWATRARDWAFQAYNTNPAYLNRMERLFGPEAKETMINLTKTKLRRDYDS